MTFLLAQTEVILAGAFAIAAFTFAYSGWRLNHKPILLVSAILLLIAGFLACNGLVYLDADPEHIASLSKTKVGILIMLWALAPWYVCHLGSIQRIRELTGLSCVFIALLFANLSSPYSLLFSSSPEPGKHSPYPLVNDFSIWLLLLAVAMSCTIAMLIGLAIEQRGRGNIKRAKWIGIIVGVATISSLLDATVPQSETNRLGFQTITLLSVAAIILGQYLNQMLMIIKFSAKEVVHEAKLRAIFSNSHQMTGLLDPDGKILEANEPLNQGNHLSLQGAKGKAIWQSNIFKHDTDTRSKIKDDIINLRCVRTTRFNLQYLSKKGIRCWMELTLRPIKGPEGQIRYYIAEGHDVTNLKHVEVKYREALKQAESSLKTKDSFLSVISHELRTPLNPIVGYSTFLLNDRNLNQNQKQSVAAILESAKNLQLTIEEIFDLTNLESGEIELEHDHCDSLEIIATIHDELKQKISKKRKQIKVLYHVPHKFQIIMNTDKHRLIQAYSLLADNAVKFTEEGIIDIGIRVIDENRLQFYIQDTGIGLKADEIDTIFQPFEQIDMTHARRYGGIGLGLPIANKLIQLLGGEIDAGPRTDGITGSRFSFTVPIKHELANNPNTDFEYAGAKQKKSSAPCVLIAEDDAISLEYLKRILEGHGYSTFEAENGEEAVRIFADQKEYIDLVILDMQMPIMRGDECAKAIRLIEKGNNCQYPVPIIAFSASSKKSDRELCIASGCNEFLAKPISVEKLVNGVHKYRPLEDLAYFNPNKKGAG